MSGEAAQRADARRNRERILRVALTELTRSQSVPLSTIARRAGVGQGTFYRNFPDRRALVLEVYRHEMQQVADAADELLAAREPDRALRAWMDDLARFACAKAGLADAVREATSGPDTPKKPGHAPLTTAAARLLGAAQQAGTVRRDVDPDDFFLAIAGVWQLCDAHERERRLTRLLDFVMDGLRARSDEQHETEPGAR